MASASQPLESLPPKERKQSGEDRVERTACYFESQGQPLFAWLHRPKGNAALHGILICPPLGHEQVHTHRSLRHLADNLAAEGFSVLRFDYHGTGDSDGAPEDPNRWATWQTNVKDAAEWLRQQCGCDKISLIGLRMGATLAALYAEIHPVENLVLWAPIVKGRRFVRELTALSKTAKQAAESESSSLEAVGFVYSKATLETLVTIDLTSHAAHFANSLIIQSDKLPADKTLLDHYLKLGLSVELQALPGFEEMMNEPQSTVVPYLAISSIAQWFVAHQSKATPSTNSVSSVSFSPQSSMVLQDSKTVRESVHQLSTIPHLFGIISEATKSSAPTPWVVLLNSGAAHRIGPGRLHVQLSRHLASLGYPCLRMDIGGLGDSRAAPNREENDTYASTAFRDVAIACDYLQRLQPSRPIILMGLCSGAYTAFQCAAQLPHPALIESIMLNPLTFCWKDGMSLSDSPTHRLRAWHYYRSFIFNPTSWRQLLTTNGSMGIKGAAQRLHQRLFPHIDSVAVSTVTKPVDDGPYSSYGHPAKENLKADLKRVVAASRNLVLIVSETDPGHFLLMHKARRVATHLIRTGKLKCFFINNSDHTFSTETARQALSQTLSEYLKSRFGSLLTNQQPIIEESSISKQPVNVADANQNPQPSSCSAL
jgi:alpha-beta hydrolase superfamily lysophospholipase